MAEAEFTSASFYQALRDKRLIGTRCQECQNVYVPPRQVCPHCHSRDVEWVKVKGEGILVAYTTIAVGTSPMVAQGYDRNRHYCCGIVALAEGPRLCALIIGADAQKPASIKIGTAVSVAFPAETDKRAVLAFRIRQSD
jgi:uncharacterized OB-fold protein